MLGATKHAHTHTNLLFFKYSRFQASVTLSDPREGEGVTDPRVERVIAYFMYLAT